MVNNYDFYGRLKKEFPSQIIVDITENCNYACIHCPHANFSKSKFYTGAMLSENLNKKMIDEVRLYGKNVTQHIRYSANGEPLLHPKVYQMLSYAVKKQSTAMVSITTNGSLLMLNNRKQLLNAGVDLIDISLDANSVEVYSKIRINGDFLKVRENVLSLIKERNEGHYKTRIVVSFVKQPQNHFETADFKAFWEEHGIDFVIIRDLHTASGANPLHVEFDKCMEQSRHPCVYPWERIVLSAKGELGFCPASWQGKSTIALYDNCSIKDIWKGDFYKNLRMAQINSNLEAFPVCRDCEDWKVIHWPNEGKGYGDMITEFQSEDKGNCKS